MYVHFVQVTLFLLAFDDAVDEDDLDLIEENLGINLDRVGAKCLITE